MTTLPSSIPPSLPTRRRRPARLRAAAVATPLLLALAACGGGGNDALSGGGDSGDGGSGGGEVTVAHQAYTEMEIMAEMYAAVLEDAGYEPQLQALGDRSLYAGKLGSGGIQVAPEYVSSMTEYLNRDQNGADAEPVATPDVDETVSKLEELGAEAGVQPLEPAEAEDANAFAVTQEFSEQNGITTLSDLGDYGQPVALAAAEDCPDRPDCLQGLESVYGIQIGDFEPLGFGTTATKDALTSGDVELGQVGTSDGQIDQLGLVVLEDDQNWQNAENLVPVVNAEWIQDNPEAQEALNELSQTLTTEDLKMLNAQVDAERKLASEVAENYLTDKGLI